MTAYTCTNVKSICQSFNIWLYSLYDFNDCFCCSHFSYSGFKTIIACSLYRRGPGGGWGGEAFYLVFFLVENRKLV